LTGGGNKVLVIVHVLCISGVTELNKRRSVSISVCLRTGRPGDRGSIPGRGKRDFSSNLRISQTGSEVHPAYCTMGTGGPFPGRG